MKISKYFVLTFLTLLFMFGTGKAEVADRIVAVVNDDIITLSELNRAFEPYAKNIEAGYKGNDMDSVLKQNKEAFLQRLIDQLLMEQESRKAGGVAIKDEEVMGVLTDMLAKNNMPMDIYLKKLAAEGNTLDAVKKEIQGQMLRMRMLRREIQSKILITDDEIGQYYQQHRQDYEGKEAVHIKQIFLPAPVTLDNQTHAKIKRFAQELRARIVNGEPFEKIAAEYSKGPAAAEGGDVGYVERGVILPEVEKAAFELPVGQMSDVIQSEVGFHIIAILDRRGAGLKPLVAVREEIKTKIEDEKLAKKYDEWIDGIRKKSFIDVRL